MSEAIEKRLHELRECAKEYAQAEATRTHLDEFKKSKLAMLSKKYEQRGFASVAAQEREARADSEYIELLEGLKVATEQAEYKRWLLKIAEMGAELWRTSEASKRAERRNYNA